MFFQIPLDIYPFIVSISIKQSDKQLFKSLDKVKIKYEGFKHHFDLENYEAICTATKDKDLVIRLREKPTSGYDYGTLSHEILHATIQIMKWVGMELSDSSEEAYTYLQGYITRRFFEKINLT